MTPWSARCRQPMTAPTTWPSAASSPRGANPLRCARPPRCWWKPATSWTSRSVPSAASRRRTVPSSWLPAQTCSQPSMAYSRRQTWKQQREPIRGYSSTSDEDGDSGVVVLGGMHGFTHLRRQQGQEGLRIGTAGQGGLQLPALEVLPHAVARQQQHVTHPRRRAAAAGADEQRVVAPQATDEA